MGRLGRPKVMNYQFKVLIVTSAESTRQALAKQLNKFGYDVAVMDSGTGIIDRLDNENFDIVLLDQSSPDMDGLETFHTIKLRESSIHPPIIMIIGQHSLNWAMKFMRAQGNDYIEHPFKMGMLDSKIRRAISISNVHKGFQKEEEKLSATISELEQITREAQSANQAKSEFLSILSHELRTPLHGILSYATFGMRKYRSESPDKLLEYFTQIESCGRTLLQLLDNLLDLAKLESGKMIFQSHPTNLHNLIHSILQEFQALGSEKNLDIKYTKPKETYILNLDSVRIKQVLRNLISNAIKFSPVDGVIEIDLEKLNDVIRFSVTDNGMGIPENELDAIFEKFIQSSKTDSHLGGTGLGLRICQEIVSAHYGRIWAENNPEGGSIFFFELPTNLEEGIREIHTLDTHSIKKEGEEL